MRFTLTAFADEVSPNLDEQVSAMVEHGVKGLDVRSVDGINVLDLTLSDFERVRAQCVERGLHISCVGSPVNKVPYDVMTQGRELDRLRKACYAAARLNTKKIRLFTPEVPEDQHDARAGEVIKWMKEQKRVAQDHGLTLLHENDARFWGAYPQNAKRLFEELGDDSFRAAFDFANTVLLGFRPMDDWFPWILPHLDTLHIKDAVAADGTIVPAGEGDAQMRETFAYLIGEGWNGPLTMEPHLKAAGPLGGYSGGQLFATAVAALRKTLSEAGGEA
ncbi:MAG: sugar phosphate isomerase/epimerase family protein [Fimbriimonas sp.]